MTAFDEVSTLGFSINRMEHIDLATLQEIATKRVEEWNADRQPSKPERAVVGYSLFQAESIRAEDCDVEGESKRIFAVYDTAEVADPSHADVFQIIPGVGQAKVNARRARLDLRNMIDARFEQFT